MCTSAINAGQVEDSRELSQLRKAIVSTLEVATQLGKVAIVTSACCSWVYESTRLFYPELLSEFSSIQIISARDQYEKSHPQNPVEWKRCAFQDIIGCKGSDQIANATNLVVIGDSSTELKAARSIEGLLSLKTIKFKKIPTVRELTGQLFKVSQGLNKIVKEVRNADMNLIPTKRTHLLQSFFFPDEWKLSMGGPVASQCTIFV